MARRDEVILGVATRPFDIICGVRDYTRARPRAVWSVEVDDITPVPEFPGRAFDRLVSGSLLVGMSRTGKEQQKCPIILWQSMVLGNEMPKSRITSMRRLQASWKSWDVA